jgi:hypothetical protein
MTEVSPTVKEEDTVSKGINPITEECSRIATFGKDEVSGWKLASPANTYHKKSIFDYINGAAELYFVYDFRGVAAAEYQNGETSIIVDVYDMASPEGAFGIYSLNRYPEADYTDVGNEGILSGTALDFWKGRYFCKVYSFDSAEKYQKDVVNFGRKLALKIEEAGAEPSVLESLPQNGLIPRTAMFFSRKLGLDNIHYVTEENVFNLTAETKGAVAEYQIDGAEFQAFVIEYPSPDEAMSAFKAYSSYLDEQGESVAAQKTTYGKLKIVKIDDKFNLVSIKDRSLLGFWNLETQEAVELIWK